MMKKNLIGKEFREIALWEKFWTKLLISVEKLLVKIETRLNLQAITRSIVPR